MHPRAIATSTLWQLSSQAVTMVLGILSIKFVTTALNQSLVGNYQTVYSYLQIFGILADFGLYAVSVRELSRSKDFLLTFGTLFILRAAITILSLGIAIIFAWSIPLFEGTPLPLGISIAVFVPFFTLLAGMFRTLFQVRYQMHHVFLAEVFSKFIPVCLIGIVVYLGARNSYNVDLYYLFNAFGATGSLCLFILSLWFAKGLLPDRPRFSKKEFLRILGLAAPYGLAFLATTLYRQSDVTLIALLRPQDYDIQNAHYGTVLRLAEIGFLLPTFILNSSLPMMSSAESDGKDLSSFLGKLLLSLLTLGSIVALFSFFFARPIVLLISNSSYLSTPFAPGSDTALTLLSFSMFLGMIITFCFYLLLHLHRARPLLILTIAAATVSILFNLQLIPRFGFVGASITSIVTHLFLATGLLIVSLRFTQVRLPFSDLCRWFAFSLTIGLSLFISRNFIDSVPLALIFGALSLCFSLFLVFALGLLPRSVLSLR